MSIPSDNINAAGTASPVMQVYEPQAAALPAEIWHTILAHALRDPIHDALNLDEFSYYRTTVLCLLLVSKTFRDLTKYLVSVAFGLVLDSTSDSSFLSESLHSIVSFIDWKMSMQSLRSPKVAYTDDIKSPLLQAYGRFFAGKFWIRVASFRPEAMSTRILGPGDGLYDALQLCRHEIFPVELRQALLDDVVQELEYAQLVNILVTTGHQIIKLFIVHAELSNSANPDAGKFLEWAQELQPYLLRIENCETEAADALRELGFSHPRTVVTQRIVDDLSLEDILYILRPKIPGNREAEQWLDRITQRWGHLMQNPENWQYDE